MEMETNQSQIAKQYATAWAQMRRFKTTIASGSINQQGNSLFSMDCSSNRNFRNVLRRVLMFSSVLVRGARLLRS